MKVQHWQLGDTVALRYPAEERMLRAHLARTGGMVPNVAGWPHIVLEDTPDLVSLYLPAGAHLWRWNIEERRFRNPVITTGESVRLLFPGRPFEVTAFYDAGRGPGRAAAAYFPGASRRFYGWKVDITSPFARTPAGFDVIDEVLDSIVEPDLSYRWKDEDEMANLVALGLYTLEEAAALRAAGERAIELVRAGAFPFDSSWKYWRAPSDLALGPLPAGWQFLPVPQPYRPYPLAGGIAGPDSSTSRRKRRTASLNASGRSK
jgi:hypothetical protein